MLRQRCPSHRSRKFLGWAKAQQGMCCICGCREGIELHHLEPGMGKKGSDLIVCRVCKSCHQWAEGKRRIALERADKLDLWCDMLGDALELLEGYTSEIEG